MSGGFTQDGRRRGKWLPAEAEYADLLIQHFGAGLLRLEKGTTLRSHLAQTLRCDAMRISKRYSRGDTLGKRLYVPSHTADEATLFEAAQARERLEAAFWHAVRSAEKQSAERRSRRPAPVDTAAAAGAPLAMPSRKKRAVPSPTAANVPTPMDVAFPAAPPAAGPAEPALPQTERLSDFACPEFDSVFAMDVDLPPLSLGSAVGSHPAAPRASVDDPLPELGRASELEEDLLLLLQDSCATQPPASPVCSKAGAMSPDAAPALFREEEKLPVPDLTLPAMAFW